MSLVRSILLMAAGAGALEVAKSNKSVRIGERVSNAISGLGFVRNDQVASSEIKELGLVKNIASAAIAEARKQHDVGVYENDLKGVCATLGAKKGAKKS